MGRQLHFHSEAFTETVGRFQNTFRLVGNSKAQRFQHFGSLVHMHRHIIGQHMREDDGVCQTVRQPKPGAKRIGERMTRCRIDGAETNAAVIGGQHHARTRLGVLAVFNGAGEVLANETNAHAGITIDQVMRIDVGEGLHAMRHGINASRCRYRRWNRPCQFRVENGDIGQKMLAFDCFLGVRAAVGNQSANTGFGTRSRRGGDLCQTRASARNLVGANDIVQRLPAIPQCSHQFCDVQNRAAAKADDEVWFQRTRHFDGRIQRLVIRLRRNVREDFDIAGKLQPIDEADRMFGCDDQHALCAVCPFSKLAGGTCADFKAPGLMQGNWPCHGIHEPAPYWFSSASMRAQTVSRSASESSMSGGCTRSQPLSPRRLATMALTVGSCT